MCLLCVAGKDGSNKERPVDGHNVKSCVSFTDDTLSKCTVEQLREACRKRSVSPAGSKSKLKERLLAWKPQTGTAKRKKKPTPHNKKKREAEPVQEESKAAKATKKNRTDHRDGNRKAATNKAEKKALPPSKASKKREAEPAVELVKKEVGAKKSRSNQPLSNKADEGRPLVGILAPLEVEKLAICHFLEDPQEVQKGLMYYVTGRIRQHHVVVVSFGVTEYGNTQAGVVTTRLKTDYPSVKYLVCMGIAGALPHPTKDAEHVRLGDLVVATKGVWRYDLGRKNAGGKVTAILGDKDVSIFLAEGASNFFQKRANVDDWHATIDAALRNLENEHSLLPYTWERPSEDKLFDAEGALIPLPVRTKRVAGNPYFFRGRSVCGDHVLKDAATRDELVGMENQFYSFEMESYGVYVTATRDHLHWLGVRGICDYSDPYKNKEWQPYAAVVCAAFIAKWLPTMTLDVN